MEVILVTPTEHDGNKTVVKHRPCKHNETMQFHDHVCFIDNNEKKTIELALKHRDCGAGKLFWPIDRNANSPKALTGYARGPATTGNSAPVNVNPGAVSEPDAIEPEVASEVIHEPPDPPADVEVTGNPTIALITDEKDWKKEALVIYVTPVIEIDFPDLGAEKFKEFVAAHNLPILDSLPEYTKKELAILFNECVKLHE